MKFPAPEQLAEIALANVTTEFPFQPQHWLLGPEDLRRPAEVHPAFANSFDWHSSVHMHYLLATLLDASARSGNGNTGTATSAPPAWPGLSATPPLPEGNIHRMRTVLAQHLSEQAMQAEAIYLTGHPHFERPYGWGWAAQLAATITTHADPDVKVLAPHLLVLADAVFELTLGWLSKLSEPVRHGVHTNSAFGMTRIRAAAHVLDRPDVVAAVDDAARRLYRNDTAWAFHQERSGQDFLSPGFCEAELMAAVLPEEEFKHWSTGFFSLLTPDSAVLQPATVLNPHDGQQTHLYGLGLTIAGTAGRLLPLLRGIPGLEDATTALTDRVPALMEPGIVAAVGDEYLSTHWLATFAWEALQATDSLHAA